MSFITQSKTYAAQHGITLAQAMSHISRVNPEEYRQFCRKPQQQSSSSGGDFIEESKVLAKAKGIKLAQAMSEVSRRQPELYQNYIKSLRPVQEKP